VKSEVQFCKARAYCRVVNAKLLCLRRRAIPNFRPFFTLLAVISTVGVQFSTLSAQTKITIGYAAVLDGALVRRLRSKGFSTIAELQPAKIPMLNQAVVVHPELLQKRSETAERILMTLVESLAFSMAPANKAVVIKTIMRRFQISDPVVGEEGYQDYLTSVERKPIPSLDGMRNIRRLMALLNPKAASVKIEELVDGRLIHKLDDSGFIDKVAASYGLK
jgi:hypothetical protein